MESKTTFGEFVREYDFVIPDYQRAYSWSEKQLTPFLKDLLEHFCDENSENTKYYLGHYILEKSKQNLHHEIVDGQQRISTVYLFFMVCDYLNGNNNIEEIKFTPVSYDLKGFEQIKEILNKNVNIDEELQNLIKTSKTSSLKKMIEAVIFFKTAFLKPEKSGLNIENINNYIKIINEAFCSVAVYDDKSVASQIFELHNTRGVKLTETEKVKALLMKNVYVNSSDSENDIKEIQEDFARIFELEEKANTVWLRGEMTLDTILMYHLRAIEDGNKTINFGSPQWFEGDRGSFEYIKEKLSKMNSIEIVDYAKNLAKEFARTMEIITIEIPKADEQNHLIGDILLIDKNKSIIFLLRAFRVADFIDELLIKRWENFILKYEIIYWNGFFYNKKWRENFYTIYASLKPNTDFTETNKILMEYYNGKSFGSDWIHLGINTRDLFEKGKNKWFSSTYGWSKTGYFLYKYELQNGSDFETIRNKVFKGDTVSIDHIVARGLSWVNLGFDNYPAVNKIEADKLWAEINSVINGIGNLSLTTSTANSSDSNNLPMEHIDSFKNFGLSKTVLDIETWLTPNLFVKNINERTEKIISFIEKDIIDVDIWQ